VAGLCRLIIRVPDVAGDSGDVAKNSLKLNAISIILYQCIKFYVKFFRNKGALKKINFLMDLRWINLLNISLFCYSYTIINLNLKFYTSVRYD
jgi:hypothetical protein